MEQGNHPRATPATPANPLGPAFQQDPYALYARLRAHEPVHRTTVIPDSWLLTRYADVVSVLKDPRFGRHYMREFFRRQYGEGPLVAHYTRWLLFVDPPTHTRLHTLMNKAFTPRVLEAIRPRIQAAVDSLLAAVRPRAKIDVIEDLAWPLPVLVICEILGVPAEDMERFRAWSHDIARTLDPVATPGTIEHTNAVVAEMAEYFERLIARRRGDPQPDLVSALIAAEQQGDRLSTDELISNCLFLFTAGHETTVNLIGNGTLALLEHPHELARLKGDPSLIGSAIEECLRWDAPVQMTGRAAKEDIVVGGQLVGAGQRVLAVLAAANRDPEVFAEPDRFDITRAPNRHLSFSTGIHFCLGAQLARTEAQIAIGTLLREFPGLHLADEKRRWRPVLTLRGLESLPAHF